MWQWGPPKVDWAARCSDGWPDAAGANARIPTTVRPTTTLRILVLLLALSGGVVQYGRRRETVCEWGRQRPLRRENLRSPIGRTAAGSARQTGGAPLPVRLRAPRYIDDETSLSSAMASETRRRNSPFRERIDVPRGRRRGRLESTRRRVRRRREGRPRLWRLPFPRSPKGRRSRSSAGRRTQTQAREATGAASARAPRARTQLRRPAADRRARSPARSSALAARGHAVALAPAAF